MNLKTDLATMFATAVKRIESRGAIPTVRKVMKEIGGSPDRIRGLLDERRMAAIAHRQQAPRSGER